MNVADAVLEILRDEGIDRVFGNPGTTELPFVDALAEDGRTDYVLGVHEGPLVAMADGYARATGRTAFCNLHVAAGTANGVLGMLNALRSRTPLVILAGQQDTRHLIDDPMLSGDLVGIAQAVVKWAVEAHRAEDVPVLLRRAFRTAASAPQGPVFLSVPMDLMEQPFTGPLPARSNVVPSHVTADLGELVEALRAAKSPAVVAGDGVGRSGAVAELVRVSETLGADVFHAPMNDGLDFPMDHPAYRGMLLPENARIRADLDEHDVVLLCGVRAFVPHHYSDVHPFASGTRLLQVDDDPGWLGRNHPVEIGVCGPIPDLLGQLADALDAPPVPIANATASTATYDAGAAAPFDPDVAARVVAASLPPDAIVVEEAITSGLLVRRHLRLSEPGSFHHTVGGGLGWGIGAAVGVALARPDRPVVALLGDGCALFGLQGLWSAAHEGSSTTFVVFSNGEYRTLKQTFTQLRDGRRARFPGMDLTPPSVDWPGIGAALGVPGRRVTNAEELRCAVSRDAGSGPLLVEVPVLPFPNVSS